jgi:hypothetical protein
MFQNAIKIVPGEEKSLQIKKGEVTFAIKQCEVPIKATGNSTID